MPFTKYLIRMWRPFMGSKRARGKGRGLGGQEG